MRGACCCAQSSLALSHGVTVGQGSSPLAWLAWHMSTPVRHVAQRTINTMQAREHWPPHPGRNCSTPPHGRNLEICHCFDAKARFSADHYDQSRPFPGSQLTAVMSVRAAVQCQDRTRSNLLTHGCRSETPKQLLCREDPWDLRREPGLANAQASKLSWKAPSPMLEPRLALRGDGWQLHPEVC